MIFSPFTRELKAQDGIEKRVENTENILARLSGRISGIVNMRWQYSDADEGANGFDIRRARIDFKGTVSPSVDYRIHVEFAGNPRILDVYANWRATDAFSIRAGEFKIPFSLENPYSAYAYEMVDNSMVISGLCGYSDVSGISASGRDIGVCFYGKFLPVRDYSLFEYSVGIFNGNGINVLDNNRWKDFSGTVIAHPVKEISLSASHYYGTTGPKGETFRRVRTGTGARYDNNRLLVRGEYIYGITGDMLSEGYYAVAGYFVHPKVQALLKYDYFQRDVSVKETRQASYIVGINYFPLKNFHFKFNYSFRTSAGSPDTNHFALQFFALF
jgi:hypothetical protein